jgi:CRISPR-associated protein Cas2
MRVVVFFDLPTLTYADKREYLKFRKHLLKNGFLMMQYSVYSKLALNSTAADAITDNIKKSKPPSGTVQILTITEKQFEKIDIIVGEIKSEVLNSCERLVII